MDYKEALEDTVNQVLSGEWSVPKFQREFYRLYLEEVPGEMLSEDEWRFYSAIDEALSRITATPSPLSGESHWMNEQEFIELAQNMFNEFVQGYIPFDQTYLRIKRHEGVLDARDLDVSVRVFVRGIDKTGMCDTLQIIEKTKDVIRDARGF